MTGETAPTGELMFYEGVISEVRSTSRNLCFIVGGRGFGKTTILRHLNRSKNVSEGFIAGHNPLLALEHMEKMIADGPANVPQVFVDDLELILDRAERLPLELRGALRQAIANIAMTFVRPGGRVVLSAVTSDLPWVAGFSELVQQAGRPWRLEPWRLAWHDILPAAAKLLLGSTLDPVQASVHIAGQTFQFERVIEIWTDQVVQLTGGHPALVGAALEGFAPHIVPGTASTHLRPSERSVRLFVEMMLSRNGMDRIRRRIHVLRDSEDPEECAAFALLQSLGRASNGLSLEELKSTAGTNVLERQGLAYWAEHESERFVLLGEMIHSAVRLLVPANQAQVATLVADGPTHGRVIAESLSGSTTVDVAGIAWRLLSLLSNAGGEYVETERLRGALGVEKLASVRSTVQRLTRTLEARGLEWVVENRRGRGYRFVAARDSEE